MNSKLVGTLVIVVCGVAALFYWRRARTPHFVAENHPAQSAAAEERTRALEKAIGLRRAYLHHDEHFYYVDVAINPVARCRPGDLDVIRLELAHSHDKTLLISIETPSYQTVADVKEISEGDLARGGVYHFKIPRPREIAPMGLYVCKDSGRKKDCSRKPFVDINQVFMRYSFHEATGTPDTGAPDRVYFFQLLNFEPATGVTMFDSPAPGDRAFAQMPTYLGVTGSPDDPRSVNLRRAEKLTRTLASLPVDPGTYLRVDLPYASPALCVPEGSDSARR